MTKQVLLGDESVPLKMCRCGTVFRVIPANKTHCSMRCAKKTEKEKKRVRWETEKHEVMLAAEPPPAPAVLRLHEQLLIAQGVAGGKTFKSKVMPVWTPEDARVMWIEAEPGVWNMTFIP